MLAAQKRARFADTAEVSATVQHCGEELPAVSSMKKAELQALKTAGMKVPDNWTVPELMMLVLEQRGPKKENVMSTQSIQKTLNALKFFFLLLLIKVHLFN